MNIELISKSITVKNSPFYKISSLKPFIDAYFLKPELVKDDERFKLLNRYLFGPYECSNEAKPEHYFHIFIGYRFLKRKYRPLFLTLSKYYPNEYHISGYSTMLDEGELESMYWSTYKVLPGWKDWNFTVTTNYTGTYDDELSNNIKSMGKKTEKRNEILFQNAFKKMKK